MGKTATQLMTLLLGRRKVNNEESCPTSSHRLSCVANHHAYPQDRDARDSIHENDCVAILCSSQDRHPPTITQLGTILASIASQLSTLLSSHDTPLKIEFRQDVMTVKSHGLRELSVTTLIVRKDSNRRDKPRRRYDTIVHEKRLNETSHLF